MTDDTHKCPIDRCVVRVEQHQLMCRKHWKLVPPQIARRVYNTWRNGRGYGSDEHAAAMRDAVGAVEKKLAER